MARSRTTSGRILALIIIAALSWYLREHRQQGKPQKDKPRWEAPSGSDSASAPKSSTRTGDYETFDDLRYEDHRQNDGDSFRVKFPDGRIEQFRLYFVDCPESEFRTYRGGANNRERIHEQAEAFGISDEQAVQIGKRAKERIQELIARKPFVLHTRWEDPFGDRRYHAFVSTAGGSPLEEVLVGEGLARIHTKGADLPDGTSRKAYEARLRQLEKEARKAGKGAWGMN